MMEAATQVSAKSTRKGKICKQEPNRNNESIEKVHYAKSFYNWAT